MANAWSKAVGIIHKKKYEGKPLKLAMKDPETRALYNQMKGSVGVTGKVRKTGKKSRKNRTRRNN